MQVLSVNFSPFYQPENKEKLLKKETFFTNYINITLPDAIFSQKTKNINEVCITASLVPRLSARCWRAWFIFSCDLTYLIACGQGSLKRRLPSARVIVSALGLWHKRAPKSSCKKYRFAAFLRCLRTAAVLAHTNIHPSTSLLPYASRT